jgi:hypothetical protein
MLYQGRNQIAYKQQSLLPPRQPFDSYKSNKITFLPEFKRIGDLSLWKGNTPPILRGFPALREIIAGIPVKLTVRRA